MRQRPTLTKGNPSLQSALRSLTSVFGMGTGVTFSPSSPHNVIKTKDRKFYPVSDIGKTGFEPATPWSQTKCSTKLSYFPMIKNATSRSRTCNRLIRSQVLYPIELWMQYRQKRKTGFEPATPTLARWCSTTELLPQRNAG